MDDIVTITGPRAHAFVDPVVCERLKCTLERPACAARWEAARSKRYEVCWGCDIGKANAGQAETQSQPRDLPGIELVRGALEEIRCTSPAQVVRYLGRPEQVRFRMQAWRLLHVLIARGVAEHVPGRPYIRIAGETAEMPPPLACDGERAALQLQVLELMRTAGSASVGFVAIALDVDRKSARSALRSLELRGLTRKAEWCPAGRSLWLLGATS